MEESLDHVVYTKPVLEFIAVANEYCNVAEQLPSFSRNDFVGKSQKLLAFLYFRALMLPEFESEYEGIAERFVTEEDWATMKHQAAAKLGGLDQYFYVYESIEQEGETGTNVSVSECLADIYQDMKDCTTAYHIGTVEVMNEALWQCKMNFAQYWGQRLLGVLDAFHRIVFGDVDEDELDSMVREKRSRNTSDWIISRRQEEWDDNDNDNEDIW